jgi:hypothetical protein
VNQRGNLLLKEGHGILCQRPFISPLRSVEPTREAKPLRAGLLCLIAYEIAEAASISRIRTVVSGPRLVVKWTL